MMKTYITAGSGHYRKPLISPRLRFRKRSFATPVERENSQDYPDIKIFLVECKIALNRINQDKVFCFGFLIRDIYSTNG